MTRGEADLDSLLREALDRPFRFEGAKEVAPAEVRPQWRLPVLLLILGKCRAQRATWKQLHVMNWAIRNTETRHAFVSVLEGRLAPERAIVRYEPALGGVVDLALGLGLGVWQDGRLLVLSESGKTALDRLWSSDALAVEKSFLNEIPGAVTQQMIDDVLGARR